MTNTLTKTILNSVANLFGDLDRPIVKSTNPALYEQHTFHMSKAACYTYNYSTIDDYVVENYMTMTAKEMACNLNEYHNRIVYRIGKLQQLGILPHKCPNMTAQAQLHKEYMQSWEKTTELYKKWLAKNPAALAG